MRRPAMVATTVALAVAVLATPAVANTPVGVAPPPVQPAGPALEPGRVLEPDNVLSPGWRTSSDRAVTTVGDETGLHVLVADRREAYAWRTVASLAEPLLESDQWIGQVCVTGSGDWAVVVYAPRAFTNDPVLMERGGFAAVVDLDSGAVTKLAERVTLAYFNPSCGAGDLATVSRLERPQADGGPALTWIGTVDTATGGLVGQVCADGQMTSPVVVDGRLLAVKGSAVVRLGTGGEVTVVAETGGQPMRLMPEGTTGLALQVARGEEVDLARLAGQSVRTVATVPIGTVKLRPGAGGEVYAVGGRASTRLADARLPQAWQAVDGLPDSELSTDGALLVERAVTGREAAGRLAIAPGQGRAQPVRIDAKLLDSGDRVGFTTLPTAGAPGRQPSPAVGGPAAPDRGGRPDHAPAVDPATVPWDPDRACAVPRNDSTIQVYQPSPEQVEWAANLAVRGQLTFTRPANWIGNGLPAYSPQGYFPSKPLAGGGHVPAQIMLGILAQESNLWQASWHVVDALAGNPLTSSGFYGIPWDDQDPTEIDWSDVDCGYGAAQVTTGMHSDDTGQVVNGVVMDYTKQKAVVLDYATNVAAGLRILQDKWNQTRNAGLIANDGDPQYLENWWFALWAYNTGFYPDQGDGSPWGVGWSNNPASPLYPADRKMFLTEPLDVPSEGIDDEVGYDNAKHPNHWSYPERVIGFAYTSLIRWDYASQSWQDTYTPADTLGGFTPEAQPDRLTFCVPTINQCDPEQEEPPGQHPGYPDTHCLRDDLKCWWHEPVSWVPEGWDGCEGCGTEIREYTTVEPRPLASSIYDSQCSTAGLPAGAVVIDDIDSAAPLGPQGCWRNWTTGGSFALEFEPFTTTDTVYPGKVDFHQIGGGFGGHFWFTHTLPSLFNQHLKVTGRWTIDPVNAWSRIFVHIPDHGAHTRQAKYEITLPSGESKHRVIPTNYEAHTWVDIGVFDLRGTTGTIVELTNFTKDGGHGEDIAWDAIAVQPLPKKPEHFVVAMGDSYSSGEGAGNYSFVSNQYGGDPFRRNACRRSPDTWSRKITLAGAPAEIGTLADQLHPDLDYHLIACSGARTHNLLTFGSENAFGKRSEGQYHELPQIEQGFLDENTTLVTLTVGGNDARFAAVLRGCVLNLSSCSDEDFILTGEDDGEQFVDPAPLYLHEPWLMENLVKPAVAQVVGQIRDAAPNARIQLITYPELFDPEAGCIDGINSDEVDFLNSLAVTFEDAYTDLNSLPKVNVMSTIIDFRGHAVCSDALSWLHGLEPLPSGGGDTTPPSMESYHPTATGYSQEGWWVSDQLSALGYSW